MLTARDIARHIQRPDENIVVAVDRLRHWVAQGAIKPNKGGRHPGTGNKRRYSVIVLAQAIVLQTLVDALGSSAVSLRPLMENLSPSIGTLVAFVAGMHERHRGPDLLLVSHREDGLGANLIHSQNLGSQILAEGDCDVRVILNLKVIFESRRVPFNWAEALIAEFPNMHETTKKALQGLDEFPDTEAEFQELVDAEKRKLKRDKVTSVRTRDTAKLKS